jgi:transglutaminase-like putative cysteine protease
MIIKYSKSFVEKTPELYGLVGKSFFNTAVFYIIDHRFRKSVNLVPWLKEQVSNPSPAMVSVAESIPTGKDYDETVYNVFQWVNNNFSYKTDQEVWDVPEVWETVDVALTNRVGDCETGALLIYVLCRLKGVPSERLYVMAGDVVGGGHAWLAYRSLEYPLNFFFMDWCYWRSAKYYGNRNIYYVGGKDILGYVRSSDGSITGSDTNYKSIWFAFNEDKGHYSLSYNWGLLER